MQVALILRVRQFDLLTRDFLTRHPNGVVVYVGCGLDTAFDRVDNGQVEWYDLDLPKAIEVRRQLLPERPRSHLIGCSVLDPAWMECIGTLAGRSLLVRAEAVFHYLSGEDETNGISPRGSFSGHRTGLRYYIAARDENPESSVLAEQNGRTLTMGSQQRSGTGSMASRFSTPERVEPF